MPETYQAIRAIGSGKLEAVALPVTEPPPGHVRIRVEACGMCHSDAFTVEGGFPGLTHPRVPGHEVIGRIDALGPDVEQWQLRQRVGVGFLGGHCQVCSPCRRGNFVNCERQPISGVHVDGGYAEVMIAKANALVAIPDALSSIEAAPLVCAGVTMFNALRKVSARGGDLVAIQGIGGLGHLAIQYARSMGLRVIAIGRGMEKRALALQLGAHEYLDGAAQDAAVELKARGGARAILATAANNKSMSALADGLAVQGQLIVAGVGADQWFEVHGGHLVIGQHSIAGTLTGHPIDSEDTLAYSQSHGIRAMVEPVPLARAADAYQRMLRNEARFRIVLVT